MLNAIERRRSIRRFREGAEVSQAQLDAMLTAAMMAPSARGSRPWEFAVVRNRAMLDELSERHPYAKMLKTASLAVIALLFPGRGDERVEKYLPQDFGAATQNLLLEAVNQGLGACWCGVYPMPDRIADVRAVLDLPEGAVPFNLIAVGVPDEEPPARGGFDPTKVRYYD